MHLNERIRRKLATRMPMNLGGVESAVLLAGTGRSGTTWLAEMINSWNGFRYMFEPFHSGKVPICAGMPYRPYVCPGARDRQLEPIVEHVLRGRVRDPWIDTFNRRVISRRRLVKDIRINQMLGWVVSRWPVVPLIFVLRHPFAVAASKKALG